MVLLMGAPVLGFLLAICFFFFLWSLMGYPRWNVGNIYIYIFFCGVWWATSDGILAIYIYIYFVESDGLPLVACWQYIYFILWSLMGYSRWHVGNTYILLFVASDRPPQVPHILATLVHISDWDHNITAEWYAKSTAVLHIYNWINWNNAKWHKRNALPILGIKTITMHSRVQGPDRKTTPLHQWDQCCTSLDKRKKI